jgi:hypothetical protein
LFYTIIVSCSCFFLPVIWMARNVN